MSIMSVKPILCWHEGNVGVNPLVVSLVVSPVAGSIRDCPVSAMNA
ncbi:hypothetical protein WMF38_15090 [Sorangium sp. So ce118]